MIDAQNVTRALLKEDVRQMKEHIKQNSPKGLQVDLKAGLKAPTDPAVQLHEANPVVVELEPGKNPDAPSPDIRDLTEAPSSVPPAAVEPIKVPDTPVIDVRDLMAEPPVSANAQVRRRAVPRTMQVQIPN